MARKANTAVPGGTIFIARENGWVSLDGEEIQIVGGRTRVREGHRILEGREHMFEPMTVDYDVEAASAAPGEVRGA